MNHRPEPTLFLPDTPTMRERIERAIEGLLQLLDTLDGDADLEPSLGAPEAPLPDCVRYLGATIAATSQECWPAGGDRDLEDEHDGAEPDFDGEPCLGAPERGADAYWLTDESGRLQFIDEASQSRWSDGSDDDRERDGAEAGIGDVDGLDEQCGGLFNYRGVL